MTLSIGIKTLRHLASADYPEYGDYHQELLCVVQKYNVKRRLGLPVIY